MIQCQFFKRAEPETLQYGIVVEVVNCTDAPIEELTVNWIYEIVDDAGPPRDEWGVKRCKAAKLIEFVAAEDGPLSPEQTREFYFSSADVPALLSEIDVVSSDEYEVRIGGDGGLLHTIPGREFGAWVVENFKLEL